MILIIGTRGLLRIEALQTISEDRPDKGSMKWRVNVESHGFTGNSDKVWIWPVGFKRFIDELVLLERIRQGRASLVSMSPEVLQLNIQSIDHAGHMMVEGRLGRQIFIGNNSHLTNVNFAFEFDPSLLPAALRDFSELNHSDNSNPL